ncbi:MAG: homocysteine S-methyltransferase family protein, partial [Rikenellaceae bacterium]
MKEIKEIREDLHGRILLLDGALGTMIQQYNLSEGDFRGEEFASWHTELKGCNDILSITRPDIIKDITTQYLNAGADIITTNTFNANAISLSDYGLEEYAYEISKCAAQILRHEIDKAMSNDSSRKRYVAGSLGPTNRTSSMSADVSNPAAREVSFDDLVKAYRTQIEGLLDGGSDIIILETVFDTLNAKAALYAISEVNEARNIQIPTLVSGTITDASGRTLSGQTIEAFYASVSHANLISIGLNCAFGAKQMLPYLKQLSSIAECFISVYPNAGLPNIMGGYDETPSMFAEDIEEYLRCGAVNIVGGCCGTTPEHIALLRGLIDKYPPRQIPEIETVSTLSGLEPLHITHKANFINIGERGNVAGSAKFA